MTSERAVVGDPTWAELSAPHVARYLYAADFVHGRQVLDAGTGSGYGGMLLAAAGAVRVVAVDIDADAVRWAAENYQHPALEFVVDDCQTLKSVAGPFDVICCFENIEHLGQPESFLHRAACLLAADGLLIVSTPDRTDAPPFVNGRPRNPFHVHEWFRDEFRDLLSPFFDDIELRAQVRSTSLEHRQKAVAALRRGLLWSNPIGALLYRRLSKRARGVRDWKSLQGLSAPSVADFPIAPLATAAIFGTPCFHLALCRRPRKPSVE